ncbi:MAG: 6-phosphogluconolactonase [Desulfobacteraceae bacterium 4572_87]|nr:MAG: 6-phosphogluconolactonase [Desulfobacteraceae bacterium 4572_87]
MPSQFQVIIKENLNQMSDAGATLFAERADRAVAQKGSFTVALSGGSTPRGMHRRLAEEPFNAHIPWDKTHIFWVDERCVPVEDPASNYGAARKDFMDRLPIIKKNVHPMPGHMAPHEGAVHYQKEITSFFKTGPHEIPVFDLILLGIGTDGHTASLFPGTSALQEAKQLISRVKAGTPNVNRLTMTYPILNRAREIVFLASGKGKAGIVQVILEKKQPDIPALGIHPHSGKLTWLLDREAASRVAINSISDRVT